MDLSKEMSFLRDAPLHWVLAESDRGHSLTHLIHTTADTLR